jgi:hypothetical protein
VFRELLTILRKLQNGIQSFIIRNFMDPRILQIMMRNTRLDFSVFNFRNQFIIFNFNRK